MADMVMAPRNTRGLRANESYERALLNLSCHSGMVRRTRPGIPRFRVRCFAPSRNDALLAAVRLNRSGRERAAVLFLGGGDYFQLFGGTRYRRARRGDVPLVLDLVGRQGRDRVHLMHQLMIRGAEVARTRFQEIEFPALPEVLDHLGRV